MGISSADKKRRRTEAGGGGGSAFVVPHSVEEEEQEKVLQDLAPRPAAAPARIQHELFLATADDDFHEGPRIPEGFNAPGAAAALLPRQKPHDDVGKKRQSKEAPPQPSPTSWSPQKPSPTRALMIHRSSFRTTKAATTTTKHQQQQRLPQTTAVTVASRNESDQKKAAVHHHQQEQQDNTMKLSSSSSTTSILRPPSTTATNLPLARRRRRRPPPPPVTTTFGPPTAAQAASIRRTQRLANAWARSSDGTMTFTQLLQVVDDSGVTESDNDNDVNAKKVVKQSDEPVLLRPRQLPTRLLLSLNADVFERTNFRLTTDGTFEQVLTMEQQALLQESEEQQLQQEESTSLEEKEEPMLIAPATALKEPPTTATRVDPDGIRVKTERTATPTREKTEGDDDADDEDDDDDDESFEWFEGSVPVQIPDDAVSLNAVHQWVRQNLEYFSAVHGERKGIAQGRVGIRCVHCAREHHSNNASTMASTNNNRAAEWECFPTSYSRLHIAITKKFWSHLQHCPHVPADQRRWFVAALQDEDRHQQQQQQQSRRYHHHIETSGGLPISVYSRVAARQVGIIQFANDGLRFERELTLAALPMEREEQVAVERPPQSMVAERTPEMVPDQIDPTPASNLSDNEGLGEHGDGDDDEDDSGDNAFFKPSDKARCSDYFFLTIRQASICHADEGDVTQRLRQHKHGRMLIAVGVAGVCCRWCQQKRVFPSYGDGITSALLGNLSTHFMSGCHSISADLRTAFQSYKLSHAKQHTSIPKCLRDAMVQDLWFRLRSNDRCRSVNDEARARANLKDASDNEKLA